MMGTVILDHKNPTGASYVEVFEDGSVLAGRSKETAKMYPSADVCYSHYRERAGNGNHSAWNICYMLEDIIAQRDEAC